MEKDDSSDGAVLVNGNEGEDQWGTINCNGHPDKPLNFPNNTYFNTKNKIAIINGIGHCNGPN